MRLSSSLIIALAGLIVLGASAVLWVNRPRPTDEELITRALLEVKRGVEAHEAGVILRQIADTYSDGVHTKRDLVRMALEACRNAQEYRVMLEPAEVRVVGKAAHVRLNATFSTADGTGELTEPIAVNLAIDMARTRRGWQITSARGWQDAVSSGV